MDSYLWYLLGYDDASTTPQVAASATPMPPPPPPCGASATLQVAASATPSVALATSQIAHIPGPARNAVVTRDVRKHLVPSMRITERDLSKEKLRRVTTNPPKTHFLPRSPVLREILDRAYQKQGRAQICLAIHDHFGQK